MKPFVVVPWVTVAERDAFLTEWKINEIPDWLMLQQDRLREGCGATKNKGVQNAVSAGADIVVILDGDCYPTDEVRNLECLVDMHREALKPQRVKMFEVITDPPSRGTPYGDLTIEMPVAASMGFWSQIGDYCAVRQLAHAGASMTFKCEPIHGRYFPLCGMNVAFKPMDWMPWCSFIDVPRFDDIWMGWLWQKEAYRRGFCFNLNGPMIRHARQSNVWKNLRDEMIHLEANEMLWKTIAANSRNDYESLLKLLPIPFSLEQRREYY